MKKNIHSLVYGALIAALYAGLTYLSSFFGLAYGPIQVRISEALCILTVFSPTAVWGLTVGCLISNIASFTPLDMVFGTAATLLAALCSYMWRNIKVKDLPLLSFFAPVIFNAVIIGAELAAFYTEGGASAVSFISGAASVAAGEIISCVVLGIPLFYAIKKNRVLSKFVKY